MCCPQTPEESVGSPGTGATEACEPPSECWEQNPGPLKEQLVPLTAEPSPQTLPPFKIYFFFFYLRICEHMPGVYRHRWRPREGIRSRGAGIKGSCEKPHMEAGNQTLVL